MVYKKQKHHKPSKHPKQIPIQPQSLADVSQEQVCRIFKCSPRSLIRWVVKYDEEGAVKRHNRQSVAYKIKQNEVKFILDEIKK